MKCTDGDVEKLAGVPARLREAGCQETSAVAIQNDRQALSWDRWDHKSNRMELVHDKHWNLAGCQVYCRHLK